MKNICLIIENHDIMFLKYLSVDDMSILAVYSIVTIMKYSCVRVFYDIFVMFSVYLFYPLTFSVFIAMSYFTIIIALLFDIYDVYECDSVV